MSKRLAEADCVLVIVELEKLGRDKFCREMGGGGLWRDWGETSALQTPSGNWRKTS